MWNPTLQRSKGGAPAVGCSYKYLPQFHRRELLFGGLSLFLLSWVFARIGAQNADVRSWRPFREFSRFKKFVYGTTIAGMIANAAWDGIKLLSANQTKTDESHAGSSDRDPR